MNILQEKLIADLSQMTKEIQSDAKSLKVLDLDKLNTRLHPNSWTILECIEHLNRYGIFYIPEFKKSLASQKGKITTHSNFKSGLLGNYFAKLMQIPSSKKTMKSPNDKNPIHSQITIQVIDIFIEQQNEILSLLSNCSQVDLNKAKTSISISNWIKLRLGDSLRVVIYHNQRHIHQIKSILKNMPT